MSATQFLLGVLLITTLSIVVMWAWYMHCLFLFHDWDTTRQRTDVCKRCGELRFKRGRGVQP